MKTTYKLFGTYWDGMEHVKTTSINIVKTNNQEPNLISFKKLLSVQDEADYDSLVSPFREHKTVTVGIDYWTNSNNPVLSTFLKKRLSQMIFHLSKSFDDVLCIQV